MIRLVGLAVISACSLFLGAEPSQDVKPKLPPNWEKLNLTEDQKQRILKIATEYAEQIAKLEAQITALRAKEQLELVRILTDAQKSQLKELIIENIEKLRKEQKKK